MDRVDNKLMENHAEVPIKEHSEEVIGLNALLVMAVKRPRAGASDVAEPVGCLCG
jgi:hypothetical protein